MDEESKESVCQGLRIPAGQKKRRPEAKEIVSSKKKYFSQSETEISWVPFSRDKAFLAAPSTQARTTRWLIGLTVSSESDPASGSLLGLVFENQRSLQPSVLPWQLTREERACSGGVPRRLLLPPPPPSFSTESPENLDYVEYHDYEDSPHCEPLEVEECQGLGYDTTLFPNLLNHRSQDAAMEELKELIPLIEVECSEVLREFLCSLYMPVCTNYGFHLPPCRALCRQAREECEQAMLADGLKWPDKFDCTRFPEHHELMCVLSLNHSNFLTTPIPTHAPPNFSQSWRSGRPMYHRRPLPHAVCLEC
nr:frizzled-1-like [Penaeus vannamei]